MSDAICDWCGGYLLDGHDPDDCYREQRKETYRRGAAKAREALARAMAQQDNAAAARAAARAQEE